MFVFSDLPPEEKDRFMDFLVQNNVDFAWDNSDQTYVATIKIVNQPQQNDFFRDNSPEVINGMDQMRRLQQQQHDTPSQISGITGGGQPAKSGYQRTADTSV
jgi:hypothetical protein